MWLVHRARALCVFHVSVSVSVSLFVGVSIRGFSVTLYEATERKRNAAPPLPRSHLQRHPFNHPIPSQTMRRDLENVPQKEWSDILPLVEKIEDLTLRPGKRDGKPTDVKFTLTMTKIRDLDAQSSSVGVRMFIALTWHTSFANYLVPSRRDSALDPQIDFSERTLLNSPPQHRRSTPTLAWCVRSSRSMASSRKTLISVSFPGTSTTYRF
jgi:hypothetical protein